MPEIVRATDGRLSAQLRRRLFLAAAAVTLAPGTASAQTEMLNEMLGLHHLDVYFDAFADLNRSDIIGLVLTLGVAFFAVVSGIMLLRTRVRAAATEAAFRDDIMTLKAEQLRDPAS